MLEHTASTLQLAVVKAFEAAERVANEHGVGLVVVVVDAAERVHYQTNLGPTMTAGMLSRCAGLYDAKPAPVVLSPGLGGVSVGTTTPTHGFVSGGGISTHGPGEGAAGGGVAGGGVAGGGTIATVGNGGSNAPPYRPLSQAERRNGIALGGAVYSVVSDPPGLGGAGRGGGQP